MVKGAPYSGERVKKYERSLSTAPQSYWAIPGDARVETIFPAKFFSTKPNPPKDEDFDFVFKQRR